MPRRASTSDERDSSTENKIMSEREEDIQMKDIRASSEEDISDTEAPQTTTEHNLPQEQTSSESVSSEKRPAVDLIINVPEIDNASEYEEVIVNSVERVLEQSHNGNDIFYKVSFEDGREEDIPSSELQQLPNGTNALDQFMNVDADSEDSEPIVERRSMSSTLGKRGRGRPPKNAQPESVKNPQTLSESDDELSAMPASKRLRARHLVPRGQNSLGPISRAAQRNNVRSFIADSEEEESDKPRGRATRSSARTKTSQPKYTFDRGADQDDRALSDEDFVQDVVSDLKPKKKDGRGRPPKNGGPSKAKTRRARLVESSSEDERPEPSRRSERNNKAAKSMKEVNEDDEVFAEESAHSHAPKVVNVREIFQPLPSKTAFRTIHTKYCDSCKGHGTSSNKGSSPLIHCQGCTTSIHQACLGPRSTREHMVTKVGDGNFVLQCRRCIGFAKKKDPSAPSLEICQHCKVPGAACAAFSPRKTPKQEEKLRAENDGVDPITEISDDLINNADNVLFRCEKCHLGFHFEHLPSLQDNSRKSSQDDSVRDARIEEYTDDFLCSHCLEIPGEVKGLVAWRPVDIDAYNPQHTVSEVAPEEKEYLIRWADRSYFQCTWMPGAWVWGIVSSATRIAFAKRDENQYPKMTDEDAIPEEWLRMEIVMDVRYTSNVNTHTETIDRARVKEVDEVLVKFQGLGYDEVVWEHPPDPSDTERWADFVAAYNEFLVGKYFKQPPTDMQKRIDRFHKLDFEQQVLFDEQPAALTGGKLMDYQMEGVNWLLFNYHKKKSVILADEMGLGKTLQIIAMIAALVKEKPKTWPFLVVVPNSTCPNWRREIKTWAPSLRVVAYYGSKEAREMAMKYELYPNGRKELAAHIVVTSYEAPVEESSRQFFRKIRWSGVIVDEGQRLKNDKNLLYVALQGLRTPFKVLMTGTPLQNNKRELFNLLQFIDDSIDAEAMDEEYEELTNENIPELHEKIKPYFLRRTKATALSFLPPLGQVIVPLTMSTLQKSLYKSILSRNPELMRSIFTIRKTALKPAERGNLNNILMQLRKVLCHPFMFSQAVEERALPQSALHRNLVQASPKLSLLDIMLPKLRDRGHRVLIFSQFLDQLDIIEDFLMGLELQFERLDGNIGTLEKQRRIDAFNAPDSPLFAFLLSTRAGGVGINLATADTVIIMDPDFNPHQDVQALSRAHRIGQKNKVLVFQLMTKDSAEEKIVQIGRKKMALDHVLIESLDQEEDAGVDLESILKHGAAALFGDNDENDIHYNSASVDKLLDRTGIEHTNAGDDKTAESAFSFARVWANDKGALVDDIDTADSPAPAEELDVWDKLLEERAAEAAREAEKRKEVLGKGKRVRKQINYNLNRPANGGALDDVDDADDASPIRKQDHSDTDFAEDPADSDEDEEADVENVDPQELEVPASARKGKGIADQEQTKQVGEFRRVRIAQPLPIPIIHDPRVHRTDLETAGGGVPGPGHTKNPRAEIAAATLTISGDGYQHPSGVHTPGSESSHQRPGDASSSSQEIYADPQARVKKCLACSQMHAVGYCTLKRSGYEHCGLCGLAHFGGARACPHMQSETQVRSMLRALKTSTEPKEERKAARKYLQGVIGNLVTKKKKAAAGLASGQPQGLENQPPAPFQPLDSTLPGQASSIVQPHSNAFQHQPLPAVHGRPMQPSNGNSVPLNAAYIDLDGP